MTQSRFKNLRENESLQLWLKLYRDAVAEQDPEVAYYRLWSILEAIAATKALSDEPKIDRRGDVLRNRDGKVCRVTKEAQPLVAEYLRRVHVQRNFSQELGPWHLFDLVPIWYRHRNCIAHRGGCRPDDPSHCLRDKLQFVNCRQMLMEVRASGRCHPSEPLHSLYSAVKLSIVSELM